MLLLSWLKTQVPCRACLGGLGSNAKAGICGKCWQGLEALPEGRCGRCALVHGEDQPCPEDAAWALGDALWNYHGGRPSMGHLLINGIKGGERGWRKALLESASQAPLPRWAGECHCITAAPTVFHRRFLRGFDLAEDFGHLLSGRLNRPFERLLWKAPWSQHQSELSESQRRRLPSSAIGLRSGHGLKGQKILLVDDIWTTGTTLLRCAQALTSAGAEISVLTMFRSLRGCS